MGELTHFDESGASRMVDVSGKEVTLRTARASGRVRMEPATLALVLDRRLAKGDVLEVARLAGIMAAKRTGELIPLCHPLGLDSVELSLVPIEPDTIGIEAIVKVHGRTGVEMEALTAVSVAALTVYDMCKAVDREHGDRPDSARGEDRGPARRRFRPRRTTWSDRRERSGLKRDCGTEGRAVSRLNRETMGGDGDVVSDRCSNSRTPGGSWSTLYAPIAAELAEAETDLSDGAWEPIPVRATSGRSLRRLPGQAAPAGARAAVGPGVRLARPAHHPCWRPWSR